MLLRLLRSRLLLRSLRLGIPLLLFAGVARSLDLQYIPVLPPVITNPSLSQIDLFGEGVGTPMYILNLNNVGDTATYRRCVIRYSAVLEFSDNGTQRRQTIYEGLTAEFTVFPNENINISSTEFMKPNNSSVRTSLKYMAYQLDDMALKERMLSSMMIPDGTLTFSLELFPAVDQNDDNNSFSHMIMNPSTIDLIAPGADADLPAEEVITRRPFFSWVSQLHPGIYNNEDVFELRIYEARPGVSSAEAIARPPYFSQRVNAFNLRYPADARALTPGYTYYWEVIGILRGAFTSEIRSNIFAFRIAPLVDSTAVYNPRNIDEVLEILRPVIGDETVKEMREYVSGTIRLDNKMISKEELSDVIRQIIFGELTADDPTIQ
ncbi:MAG: hypothetical protein JW863_00215 [Chitinispirillaceae bacterium]|nr:hypothetical protein [Chitinispirillaceae bacterium]